MLRGSAVLLTGGAAGALTTSRIVTQNARAQADAGLDVTGDEVVVRDQSLSAVMLDLTAEWGYDVPSGEDPSHVDVVVLAGDGSGELSTLDTATSDQTFLESSGTEEFSVDLLSAASLSAEQFVPDSGGATVETIVQVGVEMRLYDSDELVIAADSQTDSATVSVEQSAYDPTEHGSVTGAGEITVELE